MAGTALAGLVNATSAGAVASTGLGAVASTGLGAVASTGLGAVASTGLGAVASTGLGAVASTGLGAVASTGLGAVASTGLGAVASTGLGAVASTGLGAVASTGLGAVASTGLGAATENNPNAIMVQGSNFGNPQNTGNVDKKESKSWMKHIDDKSILATSVWMKIFAPNELVNQKNSRLLLNIIMLYAINYIYKYDVKDFNYEILKEIRDNLGIYKDFLKEKIGILSKDYLDIVQDAVDDIKLSEERYFIKQQDNDKMDSETKNSDNDRTFQYIKLIVDNASNISGGIFSVITSAIVNIWRVMMIWSKPFAGLVILVVFIIIIMLVFFGDDDSSSGKSGGAGTGSLVGPNNFNFFSNTLSGDKNNNTDIISVLQRLPQNIYSFFDKLSVAYSRFSNYINSPSILMSNLSRNQPITKERTKMDNASGLYDNIYTFDYNYINSIIGDDKIIDNLSSNDSIKISNAKTHVYNIIRPKKSDNLKNISDEYNILHKYKFNSGGTSVDEYIYAPKCGISSSNYVYDDCTIKIHQCKEQAAGDSSDYRPIQ
jgi:hypothetical protein